MNRVVVITIIRVVVVVAVRVVQRTPDLQAYPFIKILENNFLLRWNELANTAYPSQLCIEQVILGMDIKLL